MKIVLSIYLIINFCFVYAQNKFSIVATTPESFNNKKIYLTIQDSYSANKFIIKDSTIIKNNSFDFKGSIKKPSEWAYISMKIKHYLYYFIIDSGLNKMIIRPVVKSSPVFPNKLSNTIIENSKSNQIYRHIDSIATKYYLTYGQSSKNGSIALSDQKIRELNREKIKIIRNNPNSFYSLIALYDLSHQMWSDTTEIFTAFNSLSEKVKTSSLGIEFNDKLQHKRSVQIGKLLPAFTIKTDKDSVLSNNGLLGKVYLLAFGATWCGPCKKNYEMLKTLYQKYKQQGFEIVSVNLDDNLVNWKKQIVSYNLQWINVSELAKWENSKMVKTYNIDAVPFYLIVDRNGIIVYNLFQLRDFDYKMLEPTILENINSK